MPASVVTAGPSTAQTSASKQRSGAGPTPLKGRAKRPKRQGSLGTTFEQAEKSDLLGVVIVSGEPYKQLTQPQLDWLRSQLMTEMATAIEVAQCHASRSRVNGMVASTCRVLTPHLSVG